MYNLFLSGITYFQRQDYYTKECIDEPRAGNKYNIVNLNPQNCTFQKHMNVYLKLENSVTERMEKSYKIDSVFSQRFDRKRSKSKSKSYVLFESE